MKKKVSYLEVPSLVQIETTYACNQKCSFCYNPKRGTEIDYSVLDKIVESVSKSCIPHIYLIGGEPSLIPEEKLNKYIEKLSINSSVAMVTNGTILKKHLSHKVSCIAIPIHGLNAKEHDELTGVKGSFETVIKNIKYYVLNGYDVRAVLVLTGYNYNKMYDMIELAASLGMESVYIDRYEDGGLGATVSGKLQLKPTLEQFRIALGQILKAREDFTLFEGKVGFGTAIPMCIDERLLKANITSSCGVGTYFCAINPDGNVRLCNQSEVKFGNVLEQSIEEIWNKSEIDETYRTLEWVQEPCASCKILEICQCGCRVDANCSDKFCMDFAVRKDCDDIMKNNIEKINRGEFDSYIYGETELDMSYPQNYRIFKLNNYTKIHDIRETKQLVTRYQTISIDESVCEVLNTIINCFIVNEKELVDKFAEGYEEKDIRILLSRLISVGAIDILGELNEE